MSATAVCYTDKRNYVVSRFGDNGATEHQVEKTWMAKPMPNHPFWTRSSKVFDTEHFLYAAPPIDIGRVGMESLTRGEERCLRMPIKPFQANRFLLPVEFQWLFPVVNRIMMFDAAQHPTFSEYYAHLTVDTRTVEEGKTQRAGGWHVDGFQSGGREPLHEVERSYLWSGDDPATEYSVQPFFIDHLRPQQHNVHGEFDRQASVPVLRGQASHIYLIDPYCVHRSPVVTKKTLRTVVRVTFAKTPLTDPMNSVNIALAELSQTEVRYDLRNTLYDYEGAVPYDRYGLVLA